MKSSLTQALLPDLAWVGVPGINSGWATGLRNPWRGAFDRISGELWVADVGKNAWEEISVIPAGIALTLQRIPMEAPLVIDRSAQLQDTRQVSSFGEDAQGNISFCVLSSTLVRIKVQELGCPADFDSTGAVDAGELSTLLANWGECS